jgi:1-acyl-sn-glycerol-3-phosphate acyltransferase
LFYWILKLVLLGPLLKAVFRPVVEGEQNVPEQGAAILACNHLSYSDWLFMPLMITRRVTFVAKAEYFEGRGLKGWAQRTFFFGAGQVPIDRSGGRASEGAIKSGLEILRKGGLFAIFPEGTRSHDGRLYRGRTGVARMALEAGVPVIPTVVLNTDVIAPPGKLFGKRVQPEVKFGRPLDFSRYEGMENDRFILRAITDEIMYELMRLSGQEYVDLYAPQAKAETRRPLGTRSDFTSGSRHSAPAQSRSRASCRRSARSSRWYARRSARLTSCCGSAAMSYSSTSPLWWRT